MTTTDKQKVLNLSESELYDFIVQHPEGAHIKSADEYKYIVSNKVAAKIFGLSNSNDMVGLTAHDLDKKIMRKLWGDAYADNIAKLDHQVKTLGDTISSDNEIFLNGVGQVRVQNLLKFPFKGKNNKVVSILTFTEDLTRNMDLLRLWGLYKKLYRNMAEATANFLKYLEIDNSVSNLSTEKEIISMLNLIKAQSYRYN